MSALFSSFRKCLSEHPTRSELKRTAILEAAAAEFQAQGFRDTSVDRIAEHANVSKRTVYNHFESKEILFREIVRAMLAEQGDASTVSYERDRPLKEQLIELLQNDAELLRDEAFINMTRVLLAESFSTPDLARTAFDEAMKKEHPLLRWINAAAADGRLEVDDPQLAMMQLKSVLKGLLFWPAVIGYGEEKSRSEVSKVLSSAAEMFLDHYEK